MELVRLGKRTYYIDGQLRVGVYVLEEHQNHSDVCLIETGVDAGAARRIDEILMKHSFTVKLIINTHYHADHSGGNAYFVAKYGCRAYSGKTSAALISNYDICPSIVWGGYPVKEVLNNYFLAEPCETRDISELELPEGLSLVWLPGHCIDMFAVRTEDEVYFLGDGVVGEETLAAHRLIYIYDIDDSLESLKRMRTLRGKWFVPYHADPVRKLEDLVDANIEVIKLNIETIKDICQTPHTMDDIISEVFNRYGYRLTMYKYAVEGGVVRTYVSHLYNKGELTIVKEDNYIKWKTI